MRSSLFIYLLLATVLLDPELNSYLVPSPLQQFFFHLSFMLSGIQHLPYLFTCNNALCFLYPALPDKGDQALSSTALQHNASQSREGKVQESSHSESTLLGSLDLGEVGSLDNSLTVKNAEVFFLGSQQPTKIHDLLENSKSMFLTLR